MKIRIVLALSAFFHAATAGGVESLRIAMGDPLSKQLACDCVKGYAQRDYSVLAELLQKTLGRPVELVTAVSVEAARPLFNGKDPDIFIGKTGPNKRFPCLARLTDPKGKTTLRGFFVVPAGSGVKVLSDCVEWKLILGPTDQDEKNGLALDALKKVGCKVSAEQPIAESCMQAVRKMLDEKNGRTAAVVSDYAWPLLSACGAAESGELKIIGQTEETEFIGVFAVNLPLAEFNRIRKAFLAVSTDERLRRALESKQGFVPAPTDAPRILWRKKLNHPSLGGLGGTEDFVLCSDKTSDAASDLWRCFDTVTGEERWSLCYPASNEMDYTGAPRAAPVFPPDGSIVLLGAWGDLLSLDRKGKIRWRKTLPGKRPIWGYCGTPLVDLGHIILQTGDSDSALAFYDVKTGEQIHAEPGEAPGYGSLIFAMVNGTRQIIGHETRNLCGWSAESGKKLWQITPPEANDFNVPTPLMIGSRLLVSTEHNKTRLYAFTPEGTLNPQPILQTSDVSPQMNSPQVLDNLIFTQDDEALHVLTAELKMVFCRPLPSGCDYSNFFVHNGQMYALLKTGRLLCFETNPLRVAREVQLASDSVSDIPTEFWSKPHRTNKQFFIRSQDELIALAF